MTTTARRTRVETAPDGPGFTLVEIGDGRGPDVVILGGVHGDEPQGVRATSMLADRLARAEPAGRIRLVPVSHEAAFAAGTRTSPLDGLNLARVFPGDAEGRPTERLARLLDTAVIDGADILIDLHSAGIHYAMPLLVGYPDDGSEASRGAARLAGVAGLPVVWRHPGGIAPGRTGSGPHARGVPFLYLESTDDVDDSPAYVAAVERMLAEAGLLPSPAPSPPAATDVVRLVGSGDLDDGGITAPLTGLVSPRVERLDHVAAGQTVATMKDPRDGSTEALVAPTDGIVVMRRRTGWAAAGDLVVYLTQPDAGEPS